MPAVVYPSTLPGPAPGSSLQPAERRAVAQQGNPLARSRARDFGGTYSAVWTYTPAQMAVWLSWYETTLQRTLWFACPLHGAGGLVTRVVRFVSVSKSFLGAGVWRVSAELELRGASVAPTVSPWLLLDEMDGTGLMTAHSPNIAPAGFAWAALESFPRLVLVDGAARSESSANDGYVSGQAASPFNLTAPYLMTLNATPTTNGAGVEQASFQLRTFVDGTSNDFMTEIGVSYNAGNGQRLAYVAWRRPGDPGSLNYLLPDASARQLALTVSATEMVLSVDGVDRLTATKTPLTQIDNVRLRADVDIGNYKTIQSIGLRQL